MSDTNAGSDVVVRASALVKRYALGESPVEVLRGLNLTVREGEICAVMGPSGVGKSTLLACISGIEPADGGDLDVLGAAIGPMREHDRTLLRRRIGIVYQFFQLVPNLDVRENVALPFLIDGRAPDDDAVEQAIARVGMTKRRGHLPSQLSGGEMQLVAIARALVKKPRLVLADEPTGNVNVATGRRIMALLTEVLRETNAAMLLVTHHPEDAAGADRVVFMRDGTLADEAALGLGEVSAPAIHDRLKMLGI